MTLPEYPLREVLDVKYRRVEDAEKLVLKREKELKEQQDILAQREAERNEVLNHRNAKLQQLRDSLDEGTTSDKVEQKKVYLEVVKEKLEIEEKKVEEQKEQVQIAENNLELAKHELNERRKEVDKIETHKKEWTKLAIKELEFEMAKEQDEIGNTMFLGKMIARKRQEG